MKILIIHNEYATYSGEESVVDNTIKLLKEKGHEVQLFKRSSNEINKNFVGLFKAFFCSFYNYSSINKIKNKIKTFNPNIIHVHNLYPLISPSILPVISKMNIPIVMTVHNYRLICPNGMFFNKMKICEKCSGGKEWNCLLNNCASSYFKSFSYFLRNYYARKKEFYSHIDKYICLTNFQLKKLIENGFDKDKLTVIHNFYQNNNAEFKRKKFGNYIAFVGRITEEKGINILFESAKLLPKIPFKLAGDYDKKLLLKKDIPKNVTFLGRIKGQELISFYENARFLVFPSIWYEGFPMVLIEAMSYKLPIIATNIGGISEIVDDGLTGLLFEYMNINDLTEKIIRLWEDPELCIEYGENGYQKYIKLYNIENNYSTLLKLYNSFI